MEITTTLPFVLRNCILNGEITEPIVFKQIHKNWLPFTLDEWGQLLMKDKSENSLLSVRCGRKQGKADSLQRTQWESDCKNIQVSWETLSRWDVEEKSIPEFRVNSSNFWMYYDYKYMTELFETEDLEKFEWSKLGFPDRNGNNSTLWIGTSGSYTPCHFDTYGCNLVSQVVGKKKWILFPPEDSKFLRPTRIPYEESSVYSQINVAAPSMTELKELTKCSPVQIVLEPGDVLFVPSKWWHFVQSETFTISINTWIELPDDVNVRLEEAIIRSLISFVCNSVSPDSVSEILNPNEAEILDLSEDDLVHLLDNTSQAVIASPVTTSLSVHPNENINSRGVEEGVHKVDEEYQNPSPPFKKLKQDSPTTGDKTMTTALKLDQLIELFSCSQKLNKFNFEVATMTELPMSSSSSCNSDDNCEDLKHNSCTAQTKENNNCRSTLQHLVNAIGHPDILKQISAQFLRNISR